MVTFSNANATSETLITTHDEYARGKMKGATPAGTSSSSGHSEALFTERCAPHLGQLTFPFMWCDDSYQRGRTFKGGLVTTKSLSEKD
jgi:hypothetical protein